MKTKTKMSAVNSIVSRKFKTTSGFTLIELLVVISIMAVLVALTIPVIGAFKRKAVINRAQAEMSQLETAIDRYKGDFGFYPPDSPNGPVTNQLYYELTGTTNLNVSSSTPDYQILGSTNTIAYSGYNGVLGVIGFMNCDKPGEDSHPARNFLPGIPSAEIASAGSIKTLVTAAGGSTETYQPMPGFTTTIGGNANPWRYVSSHPQNNSSTYDLWVNIVFKPGQTNLICNWNSRPQINTPWP